MSSHFDQVLKSAQNKIRGPGGAIAIVHKGEFTTSHVWGYADMDRAIPMRTKTQIPICSISKQMVCLVMVDLIRDPTPTMLENGGDATKQFQSELEKLLPQMAGQVTVQQLCNMASGIRDYWAATVLWGAKPDGAFSATDDASAALDRTRSFHFEPGTEYSYSNVNFHILGRILENVSGQSLGQLLSQRVFVPAGMKTAALYPNTLAPPLPIVGYECTEQTGYFAATNRIEWQGDGIAGSIEDMIAYEKWLHHSWNDPKSIYRTIAGPQKYKDGTVARYGFGLAHGETAGTTWLGHGGALRGFRLTRLHAPSEELSVVVMLNHEADPSGAAEMILKKALQLQEPTSTPVEPASEWVGSFLDEDTRLLITVEIGGKKGEIDISYDRKKAPVKLSGPRTAVSRAMEATIEGDTLHIKRITDNRVLRARRLATRPAAEEDDLSFTTDFTGQYYCSDSESGFRCTGEGSLLYGFFSGYLGQGPAHLMRYVAEDVWLLACPRGMDAQPPGDWTVCFHRDGSGKVRGATIGCWLARRNEYVKK